MQSAGRSRTPCPALSFSKIAGIKSFFRTMNVERLDSKFYPSLKPKFEEAGGNFGRIFQNQVRQLHRQTERKIYQADQLPSRRL